MAIAYEGNTSLAFDTGVLNKAAGKYTSIAKELRTMAARLDMLISMLKSTGWTTPAGTAFHEMTDTNWKKNIEKYARLLDTLSSILTKAATEYDGLMEDDVRNTKVNI